MATDQPKTYTLDQVNAAINEGADLVIEGQSLSDRATDLVHLACNAIGQVLKEPGITLDEAILRSYEADPETVRRWSANA